MVEITSGIPIPEATHQTKRGEGYPFKTMKVGDSFAVPAAQIHVVRVRAAEQHRADPSRRFTTRKLPDGSMRLWRFA